MKHKTFQLRRELIFPNEAQKLELEKLFFITRLITNRYNNYYNNVIPGFGCSKPMGYKVLEDSLIKDIDTLGGAPPGSLALAVQIDPQVLKPCLREIEFRQRQAAHNFNKQISFKYPFEEQSFWLYDLHGFSIEAQRFVIPGSPSLLFDLPKEYISGIVRLARVTKTRDGQYYLEALYEIFQDTPIIKDKYLSILAHYLNEYERNVANESKNIYMRVRHRKTEENESKGFLQRRAILYRLIHLENNSSNEEPFDLLEKELPCLL